MAGESIPETGCQIWRVAVGIVSLVNVDQDHIARMIGTDSVGQQMPAGAVTTADTCEFFQDGISFLRVFVHETFLGHRNSCEEGQEYNASK